MRKHTEETKRKISESLKGRPTWNTGLTYEQAYGKGRAKLEKEKRSLPLRGRDITPEHRAKLGRKLDKHHCWKGGRTNILGYDLIKKREHPNADQRGYVREHRLAMEKKLGRFLTPKEVVHHKDGNLENNQPDNLQLFPSQAEHQSYHKKKYWREKKIKDASHNT